MYPTLPLRLHVVRCGNLCWLHKDSSCEASHIEHLAIVSLHVSAAATILVEQLISLQGMQHQLACACKHTHV